MEGGNIADDEHEGDGADREKPTLGRRYEAYWREMAM